jgi:hypothetical protein
MSLVSQHSSVFRIQKGSMYSFFFLVFQAGQTILRHLIKLYLTKFFYLLGLVSHGEFNSLRTQGETRPIHIWQIIHDSKSSVSRQSEGTLLKMLVKIGGECKKTITSIKNNLCLKAVKHINNKICNIQEVKALF